MESDPAQFADGIRGKVLWHNEYRTQQMYESTQDARCRDRMFQAVVRPRVQVRPSKAPAPFHNNTCDGCHVRNGSGVPINTEDKLDPALQEFMADATYIPTPTARRTTPSPASPADEAGVLRPAAGYGRARCVAILRAAALPRRRRAAAADRRAARPLLQQQDHELLRRQLSRDAGGSRSTRRLHVELRGRPSASRLVVNADANQSRAQRTQYEPLAGQARIVHRPMRRASSCCPPATAKPWPSTCDGHQRHGHRRAIDGSAGRLHAPERQAPRQPERDRGDSQQGDHRFPHSQMATLGEAIAGEIIWSAGSRDGIERQGAEGLPRPRASTDCFIGRFGWLGDRVSLEDQVANAAFVEMNMTTSEGYKTLYSKRQRGVPDPLRLSQLRPGQQDVRRVEGQRATCPNATSSGWPTMRAGSAIPRAPSSRCRCRRSSPARGSSSKLKCDTCHVIKRINIDPRRHDADQGLPRPPRDARRAAIEQRPFLSYIGTDLLMHDMGYLSQVGNASQADPGRQRRRVCPRTRTTCRRSARRR